MTRRQKFALACKSNPFLVAIMAMVPLLCVMIVMSGLIEIENGRLVREIGPKLDAVSDKVNRGIERINTDLRNSIEAEKRD